MATFSLDVKLNFLNLQETEAEPPAEEKPQEEEVDIDLNDPEVQNAAVKIQVLFNYFPSTLLRENHFS